MVDFPDLKTIRLFRLSQEGHFLFGVSGNIIVSHWTGHEKNTGEKGGLFRTIEESGLVNLVKLLRDKNLSNVERYWYNFIQ